ncbi:MAG: universal stress protein [Candidatus Solibacter sp.]
MIDLRTILVPVDFSPATEDAIRYAGGLAAASRGELHLLHVLAPPQLDYALIEPDPLRLDGYLERRRAAALDALSRLSRAVPSGVAHVCRVVEGEAAPEILQYAEQYHVDAVLMPTRGPNRLERVLMIGSVTMKVLHAFEGPVITATHFGGHLPAAPGGHILCAVDLGPASERVLCAAARLAGRFGTKLSVAHAAPVFGHAGKVYDEAWRETVSARLHEQLASLKERLHVQAETLVELDQPPRAISSLALRLGAGLVVLGRGEADSAIGRLRSDSYDIIRLSHCPVVSV